MRNKFFIMVALIMCMAMLLSACGGNNQNNTNANNNGGTVVDGTNNGNNQDVENNNDNNTNNELVNKPNTWEPESENLVGLGVYFIKNNSIPFTDGQVIQPTVINGVATFDDFHVNYFTSYTYGAMAQSILEYKAVTDAAFYSIGTSNCGDAENRSNKITHFIAVQENFVKNYVVGYVYCNDNSYIMKVDTHVHEVFNSIDENMMYNEMDYIVEQSTSVVMKDGTDNYYYKDKEYNVELVFNIKVHYNNDYNILNEYDSFLMTIQKTDGTIINKEYSYDNLPSEFEWYAKEYVRMDIYGIINGEHVQIWEKNNSERSMAKIAVMHNGVSFLWTMVYTIIN